VTTKQLTKLENRIATLKSQNRIVWIEGIEKEIIKGKALGKSCYFVRAESLNENGGSWYYIVRWEATAWRCTCEATKPCKHERTINALMIARFEAKKAREEDLSQHIADEIGSCDLCGRLVKPGFTTCSVCLPY